MFRTISVKIFAVTAGLLAMMIVVSLISAALTRRVHRELRTVSEALFPLAVTMGDLRTTSLATRITINARARGELDDAACRSAGARNAKDAARLLDRATALRRRGAEIALLERNRLMFARLDPIIAEIADRAARIGDIARRQCGVRFDTAADASLDREARAASDDLQAKTHDVADELGSFVEEGARIVLANQLTAQRANLALVGVSALVGLMLAWLVTRSLTRPIEILRAGAYAVRAGQLDGEVPITSRDEIGDVTVAFNEMVAGLRSKERMRKTFGRYVDPRIVSRLLEDGSDGIVAGEKRHATVYFSDLAGFTGIAERLAPTTVVTLINAYFAEMAAPIQNRAGIIDKFIGDGVMAFWVPPFADPDEQAASACAAALEQQRLLTQFQARVPELLGLRRDVPKLAMRIGLATGDVVVGSVGSQSARSFTVMGDTVNFSSRLEGANKAYGTSIMIDEETCRLAGGAIVTRELDSIAVVGRTEPLRVFELVGMAGEVPADELEMIDLYAAGLDDYRAARWEQAASLFGQALRVRPGDPPSQVMLDRVERMFALGSHGAWDGVWRLTAK